MWQRIQTLFLAIAFALTSTMMFTKVATIMTVDGESAIYMSDKIEYLIIGIVALLGQALSLGTFKIRMFQYRTALLTTLIQLGLQILFIVHWCTVEGYMLSLSGVFPVVCAILNFMAIRRILADEALLRAASHLRRRRK